jgi:hypothetical protein
MTSQSLEDPMTTPTIGEAAAAESLPTPTTGDALAEESVAPPSIDEVLALVATVGLEDIAKSD